MNKIVFMGTPDFSVPNLKTLIVTQEVVGVVTQPDRPAGRGQQLRPSPVKVAAEAADIPVYQPKSLRTEEAAAPCATGSPMLLWWRPSARFCARMYWRCHRTAASTSTPRCCRAGGARLPSNTPSWPATPKAASA
ncbi:MAG: hypothetical protein M5U34_43085 [Chloroflexi bacterium]|nr:hypothetical protein [Chloroflexota bacterium]